MFSWYALTHAIAAGVMVLAAFALLYVIIAALCRIFRGW